MFNKDITIINKYFDKIDRTNKYKVSHIHGFWSSSNGISINGTNLVKNDGLSASILMNEPNYQEPSRFLESQEGWTLQNDDYIVKGIVTDFSTITKLLENYSEAIKITKIAKKDYGSQDMWHWVVTGA